MSSYDPRRHQQRLTAPQPVPPPQQYTFPAPGQSRAGQPPYQYPPQQPYQGWGPPPAQAPPRKRRRVFMWVFLAVQVLFIVWLIAGIATAPASNAADAASTAAKFCANGGWHYLYSSQAQCLTQYGADLKDAGNAGSALGAGLIVAFWCVVDFLMAIIWAVVRLSRRPARG